MSIWRDELVARIRVAMPADSAEAALLLLEKVEEEARMEQASLDAALMQKQSDRSPNTKPPKGGTTSRLVFASAARMLDPDQLGWGLNLPDHLKDERQTQDAG